MFSVLAYSSPANSYLHFQLLAFSIAANSYLRYQYLHFPSVETILFCTRIFRICSHKLRSSNVIDIHPIANFLLTFH